MNHKLPAVELDYYEELGVDPGASPAQIEKAYKRLARVLHPDRYSDIRLRRALESQMRRLNCIAGILGDPAARARYDVGKAAPRATPAPPRRDWKPAALAALVAAAVTFVLCARLDRRPAPPLAAIPCLATAFAEPPAAPRAPVPAPRAVAVITPASKPARPKAVPVVLAPLPEPSPPLSAAPPEFRPALGAPSSQPAIPAGPREEPPAYSGSWFYTGAAGARKGLYEPEYVQLDLAETARGVQGTYHARFHIPDRLVSPEVEFRLEGTRSGSGATFRWTGSAGARGEGTLRLVSAQRIEVQWFATALGQELGLGAAVSVLTRRVQP